jgi:chemotaxis protein methyltransferase CheR
MTILSDKEFIQFQRFIFDEAGITLSDAKKPLVTGRLAKRLRAHNLESYSDYLKLLSSGNAQGEVQMAVDLLTTNETYFFREPKHFDFLREQARAARKNPGAFRVWSAASSTGEEAYSIAMVLSDCLEHRPWEVVGSDISTRVLEKARSGHYSEERGRNISPEYLKRFCLKGTGTQQGTLLIDRSLRNRAQFFQANLNATLPQFGMFDIIFLRNVMIYFNDDTKRHVVKNVLSRLKPGGYFLVGHSESLNGITDAVKQQTAAIYRKP